LSLPAGYVLAHYRVAAAIGAGGMGEVYRATDTRLGRDVAVKVLPAELARDPERLARFAREAHLLASLNHPNVAQIYGFEDAALEDGTSRHVLAMELVEGEDLGDRLKRGAIPVPEAMVIAKQIAEALEQAHEKGIVHRDLKPANVKVTADGRVKVLDFGLAKAYAGEGAGRSSPDLSHSPTITHAGTQAGLILGTAAYMSPGQARGQPVDKRADIWAFGVVLFEMLSGRRLFQGETVSDTLAAVLKTEPDWEALPPDTPTSVRRLLRRCLDRDPRTRLRDIGEARIALESRGPVEEAPGTAASPKRTRRARGLAWAGGALGIALAAWAVEKATVRAPASPEPVHLDLAYPGDVEPVTGRQGGVAISADGKAIAMVGFKGGTRRLFVRRLDTPESIDTGDTSGAGIFSPDGSEVALIRNSRVVTRISLADGKAVSIAGGADFVTGASLAWGGDTIVFTGGGSLWSVPATGGEARPLTKLAPQAEVLHTDPLVLPGGRTVLFSCLTAAPVTSRIESVPLSGGPRAVVLEGAITPVWSPTGHLLFGREGALWAVPFDPVQARPLGAAVRVIPPGIVGSVRAGSLGFQLSANGTLVYFPATFDSKRLVSVARDGAELPLALPPGSYGNPRISPDGRRVAIESGGSAIEVIDLVRGTRAIAVPAAPGTAFPMWTADGARLLFRRFSLFWVAADGSGKGGAIAGGDYSISAASVGPDAGTLIAIVVRPETAGDIYLMSIDGAFPAKPLLATPAYEGSPHLSPDRRWLVYQSNESGQPEIYVRRYPELDRAWPVSEGGGVQVRWSPSGREIYYRGAGRIMVVAFDGRGVEPVLGRPEALFADAYDFGQGITIPNYDVTREGRFLMLRRGTQGGSLKVVLNWTEELKRALAKGGTP
jgi:serine/threonine-protein kinase